MMKISLVILYMLALLFLCGLHLLALMRMFPIYISIPLLVAGFYFFPTIVFHKKKFRGFL
ncbi:hypothetical protein [Halobacillus sp. Marseille-Q1614]|uniref:hypothetical protein n=1 Tax=Halobacillus sp. Marseille-Q1614 TaxID=2709134 RepID=UPI00156DC832|nr:hypothetical protein [Halobacillus sp. Marseille-Q1614]